MERIESKACFGGRQEVWRHDSKVLGVPMNFAVYLPPQVADGPRPALWYLSGLTCSEQNVITKGGFQQHCARHGIVLICPDTSPKGEGVADAEGWDLGQAASFYLNATQAPWKAHYQMETYLTQELPALIAEHFPVSGKQGITGHSMGGHGALVLGLREPGRFSSISAFSPIVNPSGVPWGQKAFSAYLGADEDTWAQWDATRLLDGVSERQPILIDQGQADSFLGPQLQPEVFQAACERLGHPLTLRMQPGYDHSYYFVSTFAGDHVDWHAKALLG
ncbi:MAG: S-formylglutathione hydrolase [Myxococcota bacterium]|nr:S-formylglutathione hydrolase [Myxococcota bacterium]